MVGGIFLLKAKGILQLIMAVCYLSVNTGCVSSVMSEPWRGVVWNDALE